MIAHAPLELSIVMPCLNEARTLPSCIQKALGFLSEHGVAGEVIVADNGSTDGSREIAAALGARVVAVSQRGYGAALAAGIESARAPFVIMGDADDSYNFSGLLPFVEKLRDGYDLVMGNRFRGGIAPGAMPPSHRYFGNPFLSWVGRLFFGCKKIRDLYCGLRGFRKEAILGLQLQSLGMEFALEMVIKSHIRGLRVTEVPTTLVPDGRDRAPHLRRYRDGWRSLRFYFVMSPRSLFVTPGVVLAMTGVIASAFLFTGPVRIGSVNFDFHTLAYTAAAITIGYQSIILGAFAKLVAIETGLHPLKTRLSLLQGRNAMENLLIGGIGLIFIGVLLGLAAAGKWWQADFGNLDRQLTLRVVIGSILALTLGCQTFLAGGFLGIINLLVERRAQELKPTEPAAIDDVRPVEVQV